MNTSQIKGKATLAEIIILLVAVVLSGIVVVGGFLLLRTDQTTLGLDWKTIWEGMNRGKITYGQTGDLIGGMYTPPWGLPFLLPLSFLPFKLSWGIVSYISIILLMLSVPRARSRIALPAILMLLLSYPTLRNLADGNIGGLVVGGIVLALAGFHRESPVLTAIGILLATLKFQENWLLWPFFIYLVIIKWPRKNTIKLIVFLGLFVGACMLVWGSTWLDSLFVANGRGFGPSDAMGRSSLIDITIQATLARHGVPGWGVIAIWSVLFSLTIVAFLRYAVFEISTPNLAFLISASMLLAPYVSGNSFLTLVAIWIIPVLQTRTGIALLVLTNAPYLASPEMLFNYQSSYWTLLTLLIWIAAGYQIIRMKSRPAMTQNQASRWC